LIGCELKADVVDENSCHVIYVNYAGTGCLVTKISARKPADDTMYKTSSAGF